MEKITKNPDEFTLQLKPNEVKAIRKDDNGVYHRITVVFLNETIVKFHYHTREQRDLEYNNWRSRI